jgi:hypothetical protein
MTSGASIFPKFDDVINVFDGDGATIISKIKLTSETPDTSVIWCRLYNQLSLIKSGRKYKLSFYRRFSEDDYVVESLPVIEKGKFIYLSMTYATGDSARFFLNGVPIETNAISQGSGDPETDERCRTGLFSTYHGHYRFKGEVDHFGAFPVILSDENIKKLLKEKTPSKISEPIFYYVKQPGHKHIHPGNGVYEESAPGDHEYLYSFYTNSPWKSGSWKVWYYQLQSFHPHYNYSKGRSEKQ